MTLTEILKANGIDDEVVGKITADMKSNRIFTAGEENLDLGDELADVLWVLLCIANQTGVDMTAAFEKNVQKKTRRDSTQHICNPKLARQGQPDETKEI